METIIECPGVGAVTIDFDRRAYSGGFGFNRQINKGRLSGRGWRDRLVADAIAWLRSAAPPRPVDSIPVPDRVSTISEDQVKIVLGRMRGTGKLSYLCRAYLQFGADAMSPEDLGHLESEVSKRIKRGA
jgi:hypothetical protein